MIKITATPDILAKYDRVWIPHPGPQTELLRRNEDEILYGGARGGGKSDGGRAWITDHVDNPLYRALVIRKNAGDLADWVDKARYWYVPMGAVFAYQPTVITWPSGAKIITGHLKDADAYTKYQGQEFQRMLIEELTQIPDKKRYVQLIGSCRSTVPGIRPQVLNTANPGNIGHQWVKERFIDPAVPGTRFKDATGRSFIFIPSTIDDNPTLTENDPGYVRYLDSIKETDENLWRAWRYGDWSIFVGQVFAKFRPDTHVLNRLPDGVKLSDCKKIVGFDWGYNAPGAAVFIAVTPKNRWGVKHYYQYRELYLTKNDPAEWAARLAELNEIDNIDWMVLPHDCYSEAQGHKSIEKVFKEYMPGLNFIRGKTLSKGARHQRVAIMQWCLNADDNEPEGPPRFRMLSRCTDMIRTLPNLVYDENDIEDIDCFVTGTMISTQSGDIPVELVKTGDMILTPVGPRKVIVCGEPKESPTWTVKLSNGSELQGTPNHKVFVKGNGLTELRSCLCDDILETWNTTYLTSLPQLNTEVLPTDAIMDGGTSNRTEATLQRGILRFIAKSTSTTMALYRKACTFITGTTIRATMTLITLSLLRRGSMRYYTTASESAQGSSQTTWTNGARVQKGSEPSVRIWLKLVREALSGNYRAVIVDSILKRSTRPSGSVQKHARMPLGMPIMSENVQSAGMTSSTKTNAVAAPVRIVAVGSSERQPVYRLRVEQAHLYYANGILVTNTDGEDHLFDAASLALMTEISDAPSGRVIQTNVSSLFKPTETFGLSRDGLVVPRDALDELRESLPNYGN